MRSRAAAARSGGGGGPRLLPLVAVLVSYASVLLLGGGHVGVVASAAASTREEGTAAPTPRRQQQQPNILFIMIDDAGVDDVGYSANAPSPLRDNKTPHIDALAAQAVRLREYYAHPVCTPTRASLLSGLYAHHTGLPFPLLSHPVAGLPPHIPLLPEVLRDQGGYTNYMVGKWHVGCAKRSMLPLSRGFHRFFGVHGGGFDHYTKDGGNVIDLFDGWRQLNASEVDTREHATNLFTRVASDMIRQHQDHANNRPFFMYLAYTAPHDPLQADPEYITRCREVPNPKRRAFCGMMAQLDDGIHNVTQVLKEVGAYDDTVIIFSSDNGGNPVVGGSNYPYRGVKSTAWEGGARVPGFIKSAPSGALSFPARDFYGLVHVADWMSTILTMAGIQQHQQPHGDQHLNHTGPSSSSTGGSSSTSGWRTDGFDLTGALSSWSPSDSPRTRAVIQHDVFLNSSSYRSGCFKLLLGCPGGSVRYTEPDHRLMTTNMGGRWYLPLLLWVVERVFDVIELTTPAPIDQFFKYTTVINLARFQDWIQGTSYNHILNGPFQPPLSVYVANLTHYPLVLDDTLNHGPRTQLFDLCQDPSESHDLSRTPEGRGVAHRLFQELQLELRGAPLQWAGDTVVRGSRPDVAKAAPFLPDDDEDSLEALEAIVEQRLFAVLQKSFEAMGRLILALGLSSVLTVLVFVCGIPPRKRDSSSSTKTNNSTTTARSSSSSSSSRRAGQKSKKL